MNAELIAKLRRDVKWIPGKCYVARLEEIMDEAADALEAAQAEIKVQTRAADHWMAEANKSHNLTVTQQAEIERLNGYVQKANMDVTAACVERDKALARLAGLEKQEPAYLLTPDGKCYAYGSAQPLSAGHADATLLKLYAAAGASLVATPVVAWAKSTPRKLRITTMDMCGEDGWRPLGYTAAGASPVEPSQARVVEPVAAANKDAVLQASIDFIRELTGMEPPPIEVAPPETFQPFKTFADKVCAIFATPQAAAQQSPLLQFCTCEDCKPMECEGCRINRERRELLPAPGEAAREYMTGYSDCKEWAGATSQAQPSQALELSDEEIDNLWVKEFVGQPFYTRRIAYARAVIAAINAKERAAHGIKQGGQHD